MWNSLYEWSFIRIQVNSKFISLDNVDQQMQASKEETMNIRELNIISKAFDHLIVLIVSPPLENPIRPSYEKAIDQVAQAAKEANMSIEDLKMVSKPTEHPMDMIVVQSQEKIIEYSEDKPIVEVSSQEDLSIGVPQIGLIFRDQQWKVEDCI